MSRSRASHPLMLLLHVRRDYLQLFSNLHSFSSSFFSGLAFPIDLLENGLDANNFATIGCFNILFPGVFIALLLRFDRSLNRGTNFYFNGTLTAHLFGSATSFLMQHLYGFYFPALHFSACLGTPLFLALVRGDIRTMFR